MHGLMMNTPLTITSIMRHVERNSPEGEIVSVTADNPLHRYTYADCFRRTRQLANALDRLGLERGDRVATLAWNDYRHLEAYYAIGGAGYVCHTINPRLSAEQMIYIVNHAKDRLLFTDITFVPIIEKLREHLPADLKVVIMTDRDHMPETSLSNVLCYEDILDGQPESIEWPH